MKNAEERLKLAREKDRKKFYKRIGVTDSSLEKAKRFAILEAARKDKSVLPWYLTDEQKDDPEFMMLLFSLLRTRDFVCYSPSNKLSKDIDFMIDYMVLYAYKTGSHINTAFDREINGETVSGFMREDPKFWVEVDKKIDKINIVDTFKKLYEKRVWVDVREEKWSKDCEIIKSIPLETHLNQARKFGDEYLEEFPKDYKKFDDVVAAGVEKDGFKSLIHLPKETVLKRLDLVEKATQKDGAEKLEKYLREDLSAFRTEKYKCHGEWHFDKRFDPTYIAVQKLIYENQDFWDKLSQTKEIKDYLRSVLKIEIDYSMAYGRKKTALEKAEIKKKTAMFKKVLEEDEIEDNIIKNK